jgi:hypothetical protein
VEGEGLRQRRRQKCRFVNVLAWGRLDRENEEVLPDMAVGWEFSIYAGDLEWGDMEPKRLLHRIPWFACFMEYHPHVFFLLVVHGISLVHFRIRAPGWVIDAKNDVDFLDRVNQGY